MPIPNVPPPSTEDGRYSVVEMEAYGMAVRKAVLDEMQPKWQARYDLVAADRDKLLRRCWLLGVGGDTI
jgi:hypothetical protein